MQINRIIILGNGFDLAHGLKTSYNNFIDHLFKETFESISKLSNVITFSETYEVLSSIVSFSFEATLDNHYLLKSLKKFDTTNYNDKTTQYNFLKEIDQLKSKKDINIIDINNFLLDCLNKKSLNTWVDFEAEYFNKLKVIDNDKYLETFNLEFEKTKQLFEKYLMQVATTVPDKHTLISEILKSSVNIQSIGNYKFHDTREKNIEKYYQEINNIEKKFNELNLKDTSLSPTITNPKSIESIILTMQRNEIESKLEVAENPEKISKTIILNFNYTKIIDMYDINGEVVEKINIHGELNNEDNPIIFGYGDELCSEYNDLELKSNNEYFKHIKSFAYLNTNNYKKLIDIIESDIYEIIILGHSCGLSDRTLLSTLFEHENCVSIKPHYRKYSNGGDNYQDIVMNISRNFKNKAKMREILVNKTLTSNFS